MKKLLGTPLNRVMVYGLCAYGREAGGSGTADRESTNYLDNLKEEKL